MGGSGEPSVTDEGVMAMCDDGVGCGAGRGPLWPAVAMVRELKGFETVGGVELAAGRLVVLALGVPRTGDCRGKRAKGVVGRQVSAGGRQLIWSGGAWQVKGSMVGEGLAWCSGVQC